MQISPHLRKSSDGYIFFCPGCQEAHKYVTDGSWGAGRGWTFNGNLASPSFTPSLRLFERIPPSKQVNGQAEHTFCHLFVTDGKINFCGDCDHELNGQQGVPLPELPDFMQDDKYGDGNP